MVISSGLPYIYHQSSWPGSETGKFRIGTQIIQPSAIHFEEAMFALKSEYNRVVNKESGYRSVAGIPWFFLNTDGRFQKFLNNRGSGSFDPNPSGAYLGGVLPLTNFAINTDAEGNIRRPGVIHQSGYIQSLRLLHDFILEYYGSRGGGWATGATAADDTSGAKRDWLNIYKGYTDNYADSGMWYHNDTSTLDGDKTFRVSGLYDRYLDEVRPQPMPFFGVGGALSMTFIDHQSPWGNRVKMDKHDWPVIRPRYLMTDGSLPSGWASGLEIGRNNQLSPGSGIGGFLINGLSITLSGGGNGLNNNIYMVSGIHGPSGMKSETRPDSPSWCSITALKASGSTTMISGQYRIFMGYPSGKAGAFPWGTGMDTHKSAQWPWEGIYEPLNGQLLYSNGDFFDTQEKNSSFWITDEMFVVQGDHGGTNSNPRLSSGIYWFQLNQGPSHSISLLDAWTQEHAPSNGVVGGFLYESGVIGLWGLSKTNAVRTQVGEGGNPVQFLTGQGWDFDRANNYYFKVGHSGLNTTSAEQSGVYIQFNQQMKLIGGGILPRTTKGSIEWYIAKSYRAVEDGTHKWLFGCSAGSGSTTNPLAADTINKQCWLRLDSSYAIQDGLINMNYWPNYLRSNTEYIGLWDGTSAVDSEIINGGSGSSYYQMSSITWGALSSVDSTGSGVFTATKRVMTYDAGISAILNRATATAINRIHIGTFFETEPDNAVYCTLLGFASGASSGAADVPDFWVAKVNASSHPFNVTSVWRLGSVGTSYTNALASLTVADVDIGSMAHMQVHVNG